MRTRTKQMLVKRAEGHRKADEIIQGEYWDNEKGCTVGCLAHSPYGCHSQLATMTNIPQWVFRAADGIHESLKGNEFKDWTVTFAKALPVGRVDWDRAQAEFNYYLLGIKINECEAWKRIGKKSRSLIDTLKNIQEEYRQISMSMEKSNVSDVLVKKIGNFLLE